LFCRFGARVPARCMSRTSTERRELIFEKSPYRIYRKKRLCELLDIDNSTLWRWRRQGILPEPAFKAGGIEGWSEEQVASLFKQKTA
jgi:predicted DNA-binding transcriptional regulator AlpA